MEFIAALFKDAKFFLYKTMSAVLKRGLIIYDQAQQMQDEKLLTKQLQLRLIYSLE